MGSCQYHYQLQEERAFQGPKYEIIGMHENLLFGYQEFPVVKEEPVVPGRLSTKGTPEPWADSRMDLHFQPWEDDGHLYFKPIEPVFAYYEEVQKRPESSLGGLRPLRLTVRKK